MLGVRPASSRAVHLLAQIVGTPQASAAAQQAEQPAAFAAAADPPPCPWQAPQWLASLHSLQGSIRSRSTAALLPLQTRRAWHQHSLLSQAAAAVAEPVAAEAADTLHDPVPQQPPRQLDRAGEMKRAMRAADRNRKDNWAKIAACFNPQGADMASPPAQHWMYRKAVVAWAHLGKPTRVLELVQSMADQGLVMGAQLHSQIIHGLAQAGKHEAALQYLLERVPPALSSNAHLYNSILAQSLARGRPYRAQAVLTAMQSRNVPWDPATWCSAFKLQAALKTPQGLADLLTRLEGSEAAQDLHVQCAAAGARASCGDIIGAADALQQMLQRLATQPGEPSPAIQRTVLAACQSIATASSRGGQEHIIPDLLDSLQHAGLSGDTALYNVLLRLAAQRGRSSPDLHKRVQDMTALGVAADQHTQVILLQACAAEGHAELAKRVWWDLRGKGGAIKPGLHAYNAMVQLRATAADSIGASEVYQQMRAAGIRPDVCTFIHLFESIRQPGMGWEARQQLQGRGDRHEDLQRHSSVLFGQAALQQVKGWVRDFEHLRLQHSPASFTALVQAYGQTGHIMPMLSLLHSAWQPGFKAGPTTRACNAAMAACARRGNLPAAQEIKQRMDRHRVQCSVHTYTALLQAIAACLGKDMPSHERKPAAAHLVQEMRGRGISPNAWLYNAQIQVSLRTEDVQHAMQLVDSMPAEGLQPDEATWGLLLESAHLLRHEELRAAVLQRRLSNETTLWQRLASSFPYTATDEDDDSTSSDIW